jgi:hypothetical protein
MPWHRFDKRLERELAFAFAYGGQPGVRHIAALLVFL